MPRIRTTPALLAMLTLAAASAQYSARAEDCLAGPNAQAPQGSHWYYRLDRATHRKCWYVGTQRARTHRAAATAEERRPAAPVRAEVADDDVPAAADAAPQPAFAPRLPAGAPTASADAAPAESAPPAPAAAAPAPERIGPRSVQTTTERMRAPEPAKPPAPAAPEAAPPAPPASSGGHFDPGAGRGALPAALFGIALLLAALGTMLVRARGRIIRVHDEAGRSAKEGTARPAGTSSRESGHARRTLSDILAQAEQRDADGRAAREAEFLRRLRRGLGELPVVAAPDEPPGRSARGAAPTDIAAATLQPAIDPMPPEPIAPAPDVEQSLRQLLAAWERRAA
jgi:hypothetical protein